MAGWAVAWRSPVPTAAGAVGLGGAITVTRSAEAPGDAKVGAEGPEPW